MLEGPTPPLVLEGPTLPFLLDGWNAPRPRSCWTYWSPMNGRSVTRGSRGAFFVPIPPWISGPGTAMH